MARKLLEESNEVESEKQGRVVRIRRKRPSDVPDTYKVPEDRKVEEMQEVLI